MLAKVAGLRQVVQVKKTGDMNKDIKNIDIKLGGRYLPKNHIRVNNNKICKKITPNLAPTMRSEKYVKGKITIWKRKSLSANTSLKKEN